MSIELRNFSGTSQHFLNNIHIFFFLGKHMLNMQEAQTNRSPFAAAASICSGTGTRTDRRSALCQAGGDIIVTVHCKIGNMVHIFHMSFETCFWG